jgi:hypothetical protein
MGRIEFRGFAKEPGCEFLRQSIDRFRRRRGLFCLFESEGSIELDHALRGEHERVGGFLGDAVRNHQARRIVRWTDGGFGRGPRAFAQMAKCLGDGPTEQEGGPDLCLVELVNDELLLCAH